MPQPMPEPTLTKTWSAGTASSPSATSSPAAMRFASLLTTTGRSTSRRTTSATETPFQPGIRDGDTMRDVADDTGPGTPTDSPLSGP
jgi:hypothetical protein